MANLIRNRCFITPRSPNAVAPTGWTVDTGGADWGGAAWQVGAWRPVGGGSMPMRGDRCLLVGADDAQTDTVSKPLHVNDYGVVTQAVAGAALTDVNELAVDFVVGDQGYDPSETALLLRDVDPSTTLITTASIDSYTEYAKYTLRLDVSGADLSGPNTISLGVARADTSTTGNRRIPRVYFDDLRCHWAPNKGPMRVLRYSDDVAPDGTITGTAAATGFSVDNVASRVASQPYVTGSVASGYVEFDMGPSFTGGVNMFALIDCNFESGEYFELFHGPLAAPSTSLGQFPVNNGRNSFIEFNRETSRYWRLEFAKDAAAANKAFTIGECVFGEARHLQSNYGWGPAKGQAFGAKILETDYSRRWADKTHNRRSYRMPFNQLRAEDSYELVDILEDSHGGTYPSLVIPDPSAYDVFYGYFQSSVSEVIRAYQMRSIGELSFLEQAQAVVQT